MPLNYDKWGKLEVSDDSDIEGHPNVDHKSLVRWHQRDIHEKRQMRNRKIEQLQADIACNEVLLPRIVDIAKDVKDNGAPYFSQLVERLKTQPSNEKPPRSGPDDPSYDQMVYQLLVTVWEECKNDGVQKDDANLGDKLADAVQKHVAGLKEAIAEKKSELATEIKEKEKKITSEDIKEGFDSKYVPAKPDPKPLTKAKHSTSSKSSHTVTEFETLNPAGVAAATASASSTPGASTSVSKGEDEDEEEDDDADLPELTPSLREFANITVSKIDPSSTFKKSFEFIQAHPDVIVDGAVDSLLVEAFSNQLESAKNGNDKKKARVALQCVHQALLLQYCEKLGPDGVRLFFRKMIQGDKVAVKVFEDDVQQTYNHVATRAKVHAENAASGKDRETIQLVVEGEGAEISFNVPEGPPPADLRLGEGAEELDIEEVRKALTLRWEIFLGFPAKMQKALKSGSLDKVNKALADMDVDEAQSLVERLQMSGILNFSEPGVRDAIQAD